MSGYLDVGCGNGCDLVFPSYGFFFNLLSLNCSRNRTLSFIFQYRYLLLDSPNWRRMQSKGPALTELESVFHITVYCSFIILYTKYNFHEPLNKFLPWCLYWIIQFLLFNSCSMSYLSVNQCIF